MKDPAALVAWKFGVAPLIAGIAPALYFFVPEMRSFDAEGLSAVGFQVWFIRDFLLALLLAVPAAAFARAQGAGPLWYWLAGFCAGLPMGSVLADPIQHWHPTSEELDAGFQDSVMFAYAALFGLGALSYGLVVRKYKQRLEAKNGA